MRPLLDDPTGTTDDVWRGLAALGATGVLVDEEHGGAGMTMVEAGVVAEELGAALHPGPWLSTAVAATRALPTSAPTSAAALLAGHRRRFHDRHRRTPAAAPRPVGRETDGGIALHGAHRRRCPTPPRPMSSWSSPTTATGPRCSPSTRHRPA